MTYTFENFKAEHPKEIVDKFVSNYRLEADVNSHTSDNLDSFISRAFYWSSTPEGHDFWRGVAEGKHRIKAEETEPPTPYDGTRPVPFYPDTWLSRLTMWIGLCLIGGRETPAERHHRDQCDKFRAASGLNSMYAEEQRRERDEAILGLDKWRETAHQVTEKLCKANRERLEIKEYHDTCFQELQSLRKKHERLQGRLRKLKPKPVAKRKAVKK